ncbi:MAG: DUF2459 domain-containing protein [Nitrospira sp.]|nr:DUF2459 domain-containing protein [Nitrospira sp.]
MTSVVAVVIVFTAIVLLSACASPVEGLWPPPLESETKTIAVSLDTWHAVIAFPRKNGTDESALGSQHTYYEEWGYAERAWYLEGKTGMSGVGRALFWPTEGVVEVGHYDRLWAERTPQPPSTLFTFRLTEEGYQRLHRHLHATLLREEPVASFGQSVFYPAKRSYHLFHTCHQYAAHALREAGLPLSPFWAFNRTSFAWQLQRAAKIAESNGWGQVRMKGSHRQFHHPTKKGTMTVARKPNVDIPPGTLNSAFKQAGLKKER